MQTTNLHDLSVTAEAINSGKLLSAQSYAKMVSTDLRGKTTAVPGCGPGCFVQSVGYTFGLGVVISGNWLLQDPLISGESAVEAYLPSQKVGIAVSVTYEPEAFDAATGSYANLADQHRGRSPLRSSQTIRRRQSRPSPAGPCPIGEQSAQRSSWPWMIKGSVHLRLACNLKWPRICLLYTSPSPRD